MVTRIYKHGSGRLFLKEHRVDKGVSASDMAGRLNIERESVYRIERANERAKAKWQAAYAVALQIEPEELWRLPGTVSLDALVADAPEETRALAIDIVRRLVAEKRG
jgi:DNA-binding XRE family transcriptional regulator